MTDSQIAEKLEKTYEAEGGKKFISHLIRSFFPVDKSQYIWEKKAAPVKCCITGDKLISKDEAFQAMMDTTPEEFVAYLKASMNPENIAIEHPIRKKLGNKILGIECKGSDKCLSKQAFDQIFNFYAKKLLQNDGHMNWLAKKMIAESGLATAKKKVNVTQSEEKAVYKSINKPSKTTLGDMDALKSLRDKLIKEEQN